MEFHCSPPQVAGVSRPRCSSVFAPVFNTRHALPAIRRHHGGMGDKSLKSKQRDQKQKDTAKLESAAVAKAKQETHVRVQQPALKGTR